MRLSDGLRGCLSHQERLLHDALMPLRKLPIFTFVNKLDRPALEPLEIIDQLEAEFGLATYPMNWPIGSGDRFAGIFDRVTREVVLFGRKVCEGGGGSLCCCCCFLDRYW